MHILRKVLSGLAALLPAADNTIVDRLIGKRAARWHIWFIYLCMFIDSSFFPLPVSTLFVILLALNPGRYKEFIICAMAGILTGALTAYTTGYYFWTGTDGEFTVTAKYITGMIPGLTTEKLSAISTAYSRYGILVLAGGAFTFLPYGLFAFFSGITGMNIILFILGTLAGHGLKLIMLSFGTQKIIKPLTAVAGMFKSGIRRLILQ